MCTIALEKEIQKMKTKEEMKENVRQTCNNQDWRKKMNRLAMIESAQNFFDYGVFIETLKNSVKAKMEMGLKDFIRHLLFGKGYFELTPAELSEQMALNPGFQIVDLREEGKYKKDHIERAVSHPFDDFLKSVLVDGEYNKFKQKKLVLVCDTGHKSRVAAAILAEEGFESVFSLNRGVHRWNKWQNLLLSHEKAWNKKFVTDFNK